MAWVIPDTWALWCGWCVGGKVGPQIRNKYIPIGYSSSGPAILTRLQISIWVLIKHGQTFVASEHFHFSPLTAVFPWTSSWITIRHRATEPRTLLAAWKCRRPFQLQSDTHICVIGALQPQLFWVPPDWQPHPHLWHHPNTLPRASKQPADGGRVTRNVRRAKCGWKRQDSMDRKLNLNRAETFSFVNPWIRYFLFFFSFLFWVSNTKGILFSCSPSEPN